MKITTRRATIDDIPAIHDLLLQVNMVHHNGRPDLFNIGRKYNDDELRALIADERTPVFVAVDENGTVIGHSFCIFRETVGDNILTDVKSMYIDDLCVDKNAQHMHVGQTLFETVKAFAKENGCYNITLNVWECNPGARAFYDKLGFKVQKTVLEQILD